MIPSKSKRSESRRSSILKPRKPRQPLQNVNFDSSSNENSPAASKAKRRVSFAEKKHVKEFCHSTEQGTVWDNTYEENDSTSKGSFVFDQNAEGESKENTLLHTSNKDCRRAHSEGNSCCLSSAYLTSNQLSQECVARDNEEDNVNCDLDLTDPIKSTELSNTSRLGHALLPNESCVSNDAISSVIVAHCDSNDECMELPNEESQCRQTVIKNISKNMKSNNITIYRDSNEKDCANKCSESRSIDTNAELNNTCVQDLSVELTTPISAFLLSSCLHTEQERKQKHNDVNSLDTTNCTTNCNNISMEITEAVPIFTKSVVSDFENFKQIPILQNCKNTRWNATNIPSMIFSTNLQSNIVSKDISECMPDVNYANDSMVLTSVIQPCTEVTDTNTCRTGNSIASHVSKKTIVTSSKIYERSACDEDTIKGNDLTVGKDQTDKTEIFNDVPMEMTKPVSITLPSSVYSKENFRVDEPISSDDRTMFYHNVSMEMTKIVSTKNKQDITEFICKSSEENTHGRKDINTSACFNEEIGSLHKSMEFTEIAPVSHERILHAVQSVKNTCEDHNDSRIDFNNTSMEITKSANVLSLNIEKENLKIVESTSKDDRTTFFHNVSMEMTEAVSAKSKRDITAFDKSISEENAPSRRDVNISACFNEGTTTLCRSMELTEIVPASCERMLHSVQSIKNTCQDKNDKIDFDASMEITKSVNILPLNDDKENLKIVESMSKDDKTTFFHNVSMEMTTAVSSRNQQEVTQLITCKSENNTDGEKNTNDSIEFNEGIKLLSKSMEFTEIVYPISLHEKTFNTTNPVHTQSTTQSTSFSQTLAKTACSLPVENSAEVCQTDIAANRTIQDISMKITTGMPSTTDLAQDVKINKTDNSIISKNDKLQNLITNDNPTKSEKSVTNENLTIAKKIMETERVCNSFMEAQSSQENDVSLLPSTNANHVENDVEHNDCFIKDNIVDNIDHTQVSNSNLRDSLNEINKHSFLRKDSSCLENSLVELQSIKPPSFVCLDSEEENSSHEIQCESPSSISVITNVPVDNTFNRSVIDNVTESKCLVSPRENVSSDYCTILREKEETNIENNQAKDCHGSTVVDKTEDNTQETNQAITKTIINDNRSNESNYCKTKNINEDSILSMKVKDGGKAVTVQDINHYTSLIIKEINVTDEDQMDKREYTRKRENEDAKLQDNIQDKGEYSNGKRRRTEKWSDNFAGTEAVIEGQIDSEESRKSWNDEIKKQSMEQKDECAIEELVTTRHVNMVEDIENESLIEQDPFLTLSQKLGTHGARDNCIWNVYYKNINKKMIVFGFMSNSLLIAIFLSDDFDDSTENLIKKTKIISRLADDAEILIKIVHKLILEKVNVEILANVYRTHQDILPMLNFLSQEVKLAMDFMFDLRRLDNLNLMEIVQDEITFISRSKRMDIILRVTIKVKRFDKLTPNDINLGYLLGKNRIKEIDIKNLIKNVKKDHKFLRRYMNDVKDYIDIMEETFK